jgi:hypothetical protein
MTTISPPGADSIVSQPRLEKTYAARRGELTLVMKPEYPRYGPGGVFFEFEPSFDTDNPPITALALYPPQAAPPVSEEELTAIMLASAAWDEERLQGILSAEQQGWSRPPILKAVQQALSTVQQMKENVAAEVAADDEPKRRKA